MTQYNPLNVKLSNSEINNLKSGIKNGTDVILNLSSNLIGNSNNETNFPHKILLTDEQVSEFRKAFANSLLANIKFSKPQLSKMIQSRKFLIDINGSDNFANFPFKVLNSCLKEIKNAVLKN